MVDGPTDSLSGGDEGGPRRTGFGSVQSTKT